MDTMTVDIRVPLWIGFEVRTDVLSMELSPAVEMICEGDKTN